jgi:NADP-dependent 3-hydroxy acid dehydrogenase YdfG
MDNKVIIIIGASGGIGSVLAQYFSDAGAKLTLSARNVDKLNVLKSKLPNESIAVQVDATEIDDVRNAFKVTKEKFGHVDAIVISAGTWKQLGIDATEEEALALANEHYQSIFLPGFVAGFIAQKFFQAQGYGLIVNISSHAAVKPELPGNLTYAAFKAAIRQNMLSMRSELVGTNVRVVDLQPAIVNTPDNTGLDTEEKRSGAVQPKDIAKWIVENIDNPNIPKEHLFESKVTL